MLILSHAMGNAYKFCQFTLVGRSHLGDIHVKGNNKIIFTGKKL